MQTTVTDHHARTGAYQQPRPQHIVALQGANAVRLARAEQKRRLATARDTNVARALAAELIADPPAELVTITVRELLLSCRRVGERVVSELLNLAGLRGPELLGDGTPRHGALTPRQREALIAVLNGTDVPVLEAA